MIWFLKDPWFETLRAGQKRWDGRRITSQTLNVKLGDKIIFGNIEKYAPTITTMVEDIMYYDTFSHALEHIDCKIIFPHENMTNEIAEHIFKKYMSKKEQKNFGILMFKIEVIEFNISTCQL
jgi:ASC-1-like (ASCH) protein